MIQTVCPITEAGRAAAGLTLLHIRAPEIAARARPGQFVMVRCSDGDDPYLRRPFPIFAAAPPDLSILVRADEPGRRWLAHQGTGRVLDIVGPLGQAFSLASQTRHVLLVAEGMGVAALAFLAATATSTGHIVTLLAGAPTAGTALPPDLLPAEVEYRLATGDGSRGEHGGVAVLLPDVIQWADQLCAAGSLALYRALADVIARRRLLADEDFAQVWLLGPAACVTGVCLSCTVAAKHGPSLSCRDGPVYRLRDLDLTEPSTR
jgi:dihydroorotate dehydrogenase electron transfer subunit